MERNLIAGIAADRNEARITLTGVPDQPGTVARDLRPARRGRHPGRHDRPRGDAEHAARRDLTFTVPRASLAQAVAVIEQRKDEIGYDELVTDDAVAKVSIVGVGIRSNPQLAAKMFEMLAERRINLLAVSTSEIKVSALIAEDELELAVRVLHTAFGLDAGAGGMSGEGLIAEPRAVHADGRPRAPQGADAPRHRVPRLRRRDPGRRDELDFASATSSPRSPMPAASA